MPYDSSLDVEIFSKAWENDMGKIVVSVHSYNKGVKKLQITRSGQDKEGKAIFAKLGRLAKDEIEKLKREAAEHAAEDEKKKSLIEARNQAESLIYVSEKAIKDAGEKLPQVDALAYAWNKKKKCKVRRIAMDGIPFFILF